MKRGRVFQFLLCLISLQLFAQKEFLNDIDTHDEVYDQYIHTARLLTAYPGYQNINSGLNVDITDPSLNLLPVFPLGSHLSVQLSFDDFSPEDRNYGYSILYCNYDWTISSLTAADYLDGFSDDIIQSYNFSNATRQNYRRFDIGFPNDMMKPLISGNYLFVVFDDDTEEVVLVKRFAIHETSQQVASGRVTVASAPGKRYTHNELSLEVRTGQLKNYFLPEEIKIVAQQNGRWDNALINIPYSRLDRSTIYYNQLNTNLFEAGSEFRSFDTRLLLMQGEGVASVQQTDDDYNITLATAKPKKKTFFINQLDINGGYLISRYNSRNSLLEADYANVDFSLESKSGRLNGDVYILGELNDWNLNEKSKLEYRPETGLYQKRLRLKQGYYNYAFVFKPNIDGAQASFEMFEGNFSEASNQYRVYVYQKNNGIPLHDKLLQVLTFDINR